MLNRTVKDMGWNYKLCKWYTG